MWSLRSAGGGPEADWDRDRCMNLKAYIHTVFCYVGGEARRPEGRKDKGGRRKNEGGRAKEARWRMQGKGGNRNERRKEGKREGRSGGKHKLGKIIGRVQNRNQGAKRCPTKM